MHFVDPSLLYTQDKESVADADRRRAVDAASLHGKYHSDTVSSSWHHHYTVKQMFLLEMSRSFLIWLYCNLLDILYFIFPSQIHITHKNQASMLMAPQAKSSGFFNYK